MSEDSAPTTTPPISAPSTAETIAATAESAFQGFLKKATGVLQNLGIGEQLRFPGKDGEMLYSKNNVCVHPAKPPGPIHSPDSPNHLPQLPLHFPGTLDIFVISRHSVPGLLNKV